MINAPGPFPPYSASLDQLLTALKSIALSPAFTTEVENYKAQLQTAEIQTTLIEDAQGNRIPINFSPTELTDFSYIDNAFAQVSISAVQKVLGPWPLCEIIGQPGRVQSSVRTAAERFINQIAEAEIYSIDVFCWSASSDDAKHNQINAMTLAYCFKSLIRRNQQLGGIVQLIQPMAPVEALAGHPGGPTLACSRVRFESYVLLP